MSVARDLRTLLRFPDFRKLLTVRLLSQSADGIYQIALAAYVVFSPEKETSPAAIASALAVLLLPYSLLGPFAGVLLDRWQRRQVLFFGNLLLRTALAAVTAALVFGAVPEWLVFLSALTVTAVNRFVLAGLSAALPRVVDGERLVVANSLSPTAGTLAATLGGGVAFVVRFLAPGAGRDADALVLLTAAAVYLLAGLASLRMGRELLGPRSRRGAAPHPRCRRQHRTGTARGTGPPRRAPRRRVRADSLGGDALLLRRADGHGADDAGPVRMERKRRHRRWAPAAGSRARSLRAGVLHRRRHHTLGGAPVRHLRLDGAVRGCRGRAGAGPGAVLPSRADTAGRVRAGAGDPGRKDRHGHRCPDLRGRQLPRPGLLPLRHALQRVVSYVGAAGVAAAMLPPDGRPSAAVVVVGVAVLYALLAAALFRVSRETTLRGGTDRVSPPAGPTTS